MVSVELGKLACTGLEGHFGTDLTVGTRKGPVALPYKLKAGAQADRRRPSLSLTSAEAKFDRRSIATPKQLFSQEARRLRISTTRLATHAVLVYLAELDFLGVVPRQTY